MTGNISSSQAQGNARAASNTQGYLTSAIGGEDRRAPVNTIDESVWETLRRDLLAVWEKMRQVLWPKYLLGGMLNRGGGIGGEEAGQAGSIDQIRGLVGRWPDADTVLQSNMSEGLRDWDLWYDYPLVTSELHANSQRRGPLLFSLLLSFLLSLNAREKQAERVFSGVFAMIWIAEAVVTLQIKLLGGNMYVLFCQTGLTSTNHDAVHSSSRSPSLATRSSQWSSLPSCQPFKCRPLSGYRSTVFWVYGR